jgi:VIT1/CCC1 family predicted Fe2+/Mn2+ transporter
MLENWRDEMESAWLYAVLAHVERDETRSGLFAALKRMAETQARRWAQEIEKTGGRVPAFIPSARTRVVGVLIRAFGPRRLLPVLAAMKVRGISVYRVSRAPRTHAMPATLADVGERHRGVGQGGNLRAAVFGVNDGLVSNTSLIMGVAGATGDTKIILLSGAAGLLAGAFSMAAGEYVSMRSQREMYEFQIGLEKDELALYPEEEQEELALIYAARGIPLAQARAMAGEMLKTPADALDTLAREELGLNPDDLGSPWGAAISSFLAFSIGAVIPLVPFLFMRDAAVPVAALVAGVALAAVGASLSLFSGRSAWWGGARTLAIGAAAGGATYLIGRLLGVTLG